MKVTAVGAAPPAHRRDVGDLLRRHRERRGFSIQVAAEQAPMSEVTWGKIEKGGSVKSATLLRAADVLGIPGDLVVDAWRDADHLPALEQAIRGRRHGTRVDLSTVPDTDLLGELEHRLVTRRHLAGRFLADQGELASQAGGLGLD